MGNSVGILSVASVTHRGYRRPRNEDCVLVGNRILCGDFEGWEQDFSVRSGVIPLVIADGLGGHRGGQIASRFVVSELDARFSVMVSAQATSFPEVLNDLSLGLAAQMQQDPDVSGMGSTIVLVCIEPNALTFANVGDSRAYFFDHQGLMQISVDDVPEPKAGLKGKPRSAAITQALGGAAAGLKSVVPHLRTMEFPMGEWSIVLCSDGVTDFVPDADILEALLGGNFDVMQLVNKALAAGGLDNISIIAATFRPGQG